uniref:FHA domain-containing protein n=1 Tax=Aplanochytrium stocchinoi TaxID=215587 RepID=A0A7S3LT62_9STRA
MGTTPSHNSNADVNTEAGSETVNVNASSIATASANNNNRSIGNANVGVQANIQNDSNSSSLGPANATAEEIQKEENSSNVNSSENINNTASSNHSWRKGFGNGSGSRRKLLGNGNDNNSPNNATSCEGSDSKSASAAAEKSGSNNSSAPSVWCLVKSKTRQHHSSKEVKKSMWFEARDGNVFTIGRDSSCDLYLDDDRCDLLNARIVPSLIQSTGRWGVFLHPDARMYRLIGMMGKSSPPEALKKGSVIKVGSISLEVIDFCTDEAHDFAEQFALEIEKGYSKKKSSLKLLNKLDTDSDKDVVKESKDDSGSCDSECTLERDSSPDSCLADGNKEKTMNDERKLSTDHDDTDDADEAICYICWGGIEPEVSDGEDIQTSLDDKMQHESEKKETSDTESHVKKKMKEDKEQKINPMIKNPCGNCSGCSKYVHLQCLLTWIKKSGSGHCTICNGVLPSHFASSPPNMELKIVRHRRGHSWVGTRRFRLSFSDTSRRLIGNSSRADVRLPDRSVSELHAVVKFDRKKKQFFLTDNHSKGGTFLQISEPIELLHVPTPSSSGSGSTTHLSEFKIGRTNLSIKFSPRKTSMMLNMMGWGRNLK